MATFNLSQILNETLFRISIKMMLDDVLDFLEFSENNLSWQKERELRKARSEAEKEQFEDEYVRAQFRGHSEDNVTYWFDMILAQRLRYAGLTAFITTDRVVCFWFG